MNISPYYIWGSTSEVINFYIVIIIIGFIAEIGLIILFFKGYRVFKANQISDYRKHYISKEECRKYIRHKKFQLIVGSITILPTLFLSFVIWIFLMIFAMGFFKRK